MKQALSLLAVLLLTLIGCVTEGVCLGSRNEYYLQLGIKMFPSLVGGNLDLAAQKNAAGKLLLLVVYRENRASGEQVANTLNNSIQVIDQFPIQVALCMVDECRAFAQEAVAGVFLAEPLTARQIEAIKQFSIHTKAVLFSPFEGDVQNGIMTGLFISTQVKPALNLLTLRQSGIRMNTLFLKVAKTYE
ncbi:MAG: hypothetical protein HQL87_11060 [Magnetococcales bacterium]|nr:hypothetical protein [Magnetococcales bacterium]